MPYKLISLVFLLFFLIINKAYSADEFILPVKKPSIFKKIEKNITSKTTTNLPQKKPILQPTTSEQNIVKEKKEINTQEQRGNATVITAMVPLANMFGYINSLRSMSQGRAQYSMFFDHYSKVPQNVQDEVTKKAS